MKETKVYQGIIFCCEEKTTWKQYPPLPTLNSLKLSSHQQLKQLAFANNLYYSTNLKPNHPKKQTPKISIKELNIKFKKISPSKSPKPDHQSCKQTNLALTKDYTTNHPLSSHCRTSEPYTNLGRGQRINVMNSPQRHTLQYQQNVGHFPHKFQVYKKNETFTFQKDCSRTQNQASPLIYSEGTPGGRKQYNEQDFCINGQIKEIQQIKSPKYYKSECGGRQIEKGKITNPSNKFDEFLIQGIESKVLKPKQLQKIVQEKPQDLSRGSNYFLKINSSLTAQHKNQIKKSDLQMVKASCISQLSQNQNTNQTPINPNPEATTQSAHRRYQAQYGYSIMSINSCIEQVKGSHINHNLQQSVVMHDFFNPAQKLFHKWNRKGQSREDQSEGQLQ